MHVVHRLALPDLDEAGLPPHPLGITAPPLLREGSSARPAPEAWGHRGALLCLGARPDRGCDGHLLQVSRLRLPLRG